MAKNKRAQWAAMDAYPHVVQPSIEEALSGDFLLKGKWSQELFKNDNPIVLELGCGKGEYSVGLARRYPDKNFIGVDIKGHRMWRGATTAIEEGIPNVAFLRTRVDFVKKIFAENEISEIWLTFSDPQPKKENKRLTCPTFVNRYKTILNGEGLVHLKTDSDLLFEYTMEQIEEFSYPCLFSTWDLYNEAIHDLDDDTADILNIRTYYEQIWLDMGKDIKYCKFLVNA